MTSSKLCLPVAALGLAAFLSLPPRTAEAFSVLGCSLSLSQRDVRADAGPIFPHRHQGL